MPRPSSGPDAVEVTLTSAEFFDLRATNLVLTVGGERSTRARHPDGELRTVQFVLPRTAFDRLAGACAARRRAGARGAGDGISHGFCSC